MGYQSSAEAQYLNAPTRFFPLNLKWSLFHPPNTGDTDSTEA